MAIKHPNGWMDKFSSKASDVPRDPEDVHRLVQTRTLGGYTVPSSIPVQALDWPVLTTLPADDDDYQGGGVVLELTEGTTNRYEPFIYDYDQRAWRSLIHVETANIADSAVTSFKLDADVYTTWSELPSPSDGAVAYWRQDHGAGYSQVTKMIGDGTYWVPEAGTKWFGANVTFNDSVDHNTWTTVASSDLNIPSGGVFAIGVDAVGIRITSSHTATRVRTGVNSPEGGGTDYEVGAHWTGGDQNGGGPTGGTPVITTVSNSDHSSSDNFTMRVLQQSGSTETIDIQTSAHVVCVPLRLNEAT